MQMDLFGNVPEILIDSHETMGRRKNAVHHLIELLEKNGVQYAVQTIPVGDILGPDGVAIERKTVNDLVGTLRGSTSGVPRLTRQLEGLLQYERPYLLVENLLAIRRDPMKGCIYVPFSTKQTKQKYFVTLEHALYIHPSALDALLDSVRERGVEVIEGFNALHSAGLLFALLTGQDTQHAGPKRLPTIRTRKGLASTAEEQEFFIAGLPGINVVRARALLDHFGSPIEAITSTDDWTQVAGIGPKTVASAKRVLFTEYRREHPAEEETGDKDEPEGTTRVTEDSRET